MPGQGKRGPALVRPETLRKLQTPVIAMALKKDAQPGTPSRGKYALGCGEVALPWASAPLIYHGGSNGMNLAHIYLDSERDFAMVLVTNIGGDQADQAFHALAPELYQKFAPPPGTAVKP